MEFLYLIIGVLVAVFIIKEGLVRPDIAGVLLLIAALFYFHDIFSTDFFITALIVLVVMGLIPFATHIIKSAKRDEELK